MKLSHLFFLFFSSSVFAQAPKVCAALVYFLPLIEKHSPDHTRKNEDGTFEHSVTNVEERHGTIILTIRTTSEEGARVSVLQYRPSGEGNYEVRETVETTRVELADGQRLTSLKKEERVYFTDKAPKILRHITKKAIKAPARVNLEFLRHEQERIREAAFEITSYYQMQFDRLKKDLSISNSELEAKTEALRRSYPHLAFPDRRLLALLEVAAEQPRFVNTLRVAARSYGISEINLLEAFRWGDTNLFPNDGQTLEEGIVFDIAAQCAHLLDRESVNEVKHFVRRVSALLQNP